MFCKGEFLILGWSAATSKQFAQPFLNLTKRETMNNIYEIKVNNKWQYVLAYSISNLAENVDVMPKVQDWRCPGMLSRGESLEIRSTCPHIKTRKGKS